MMKIGMVGVGNISGIYLKNFKETFKNIELVAVCDLIRERAEKAQEEYGIPIPISSSSAEAAHFSIWVHTT